MVCLRKSLIHRHKQELTEVNEPGESEQVGGLWRWYLVFVKVRAYEVPQASIIQAFTWSVDKVTISLLLL